MGEPISMEPYLERRKNKKKEQLQNEFEENLLHITEILSVTPIMALDESKKTYINQLVDKLKDEECTEITIKKIRATRTVVEDFDKQWKELYNKLSAKPKIIPKNQEEQIAVEKEIASTKKAIKETYDSTVNKIEKIVGNDSELENI